MIFFLEKYFSFLLTHVRLITHKVWQIAPLSHPLPGQDSCLGFPRKGWPFQAKTSLRNGRFVVCQLFLTASPRGPLSHRLLILLLDRPVDGRIEGVRLEHRSLPLLLVSRADCVRAVRERGVSRHSGNQTACPSGPRRGAAAGAGQFLVRTIGSFDSVGAAGTQEESILRGETAVLGGDAGQTHWSHCCSHPSLEEEQILV